MRPTVLALLIAITVPTAAAVAQAQDRTQDRTGAVDRTWNEPIYGSQLMTQQERAEYSARMRAARTEQEREQIRNEHHARMEARARERGITLPDEPPPRGAAGAGRGAGPGGGQGGGMGPGRRY